MLGYKPSSLSYIIYKIPSENKYKKFCIPKKSGAPRQISAPIEPLKTLQRRLANILYACCDEIDGTNSLRPLSHGFRKGYSIITNARPHKRRRYVLNLDLQDFFPSCNFGRVRGFFIKNRDFQLNDKVATLLAQIACYENMLPQGSPCSPVVADLLAHLLDVRLAQLAKHNGVTYTRYADDLTFSTNQEPFPSALAVRFGDPGSDWKLGDDLIEKIQSTGFAVNPSKTRMQSRTSRQIVTGLMVNAKVNIRPEYYRVARAMCHSLFMTGTYYRPVTSTASEGATAEALQAAERISILGPLEGILNHIHNVKNSGDHRDDLEKKKDATTARKLYSRFLAYRNFVALKRPLIVCEGKTDDIYLKAAIRKLPIFHPKLGSWSGAAFTSAVSFFHYADKAPSLSIANKASDVLELGGGTGDLKYFILNYKKVLQNFKYRPLEYPVIIMIDNDSGANEIFSVINKNFDISISIKSTKPFYHITDNLYLVKTPERGTTSISCIEDFFAPSVLNKKLNGKEFNRNKAHKADGQYGKAKFAAEVVRPNADKIDFSKFVSLLDRFVAVMDDYKPPATSAATESSHPSHSNPQVTFTSGKFR